MGSFPCVVLSKGGKPPFVSPTGEGNEGEKIFFLVIGTFKGCPLSHDFVVTASRPATGRKNRGFAKQNGSFANSQVVLGELAERERG